MKIALEKIATVRKVFSTVYDKEDYVMHCEVYKNKQAKDEDSFYNEGFFQFVKTIERCIMPSPPSPCTYIHSCCIVLYCRPTRHVVTFTHSDVLRMSPV